MLRATGRFLAIERLVHPGAIGHAGHGWTPTQAAAFALRCRRAGFTDVEVDRNQTGSHELLTGVTRPPN